MYKDKCIIVDLDGTLANIDHRRHFVESKPKDWKGFFSIIEDDTVNNWCRDLIKRYYLDDDYIVYLLTGRPERYRWQSLQWLKYNKVPSDYLFMRNNEDYRSDYVVKREIYKEHIEPYCNVMFVIDDRDSVVKMWRELGLTCLQCAKGDF